MGEVITAKRQAIKVWKTGKGTTVLQLGSQKGRATMPEKGTSRREATSWERVWGIPLLHGLFGGD